MENFKVTKAELLKDSEFLKKVVQQYFSPEYFDKWLPKHSEQIGYVFL